MRRYVIGSAIGAAALTLAIGSQGQQEGGGDLIPTTHIPFTTGLLEFQTRLEGAQPTGAGVKIAQSEPNTNPGYRPDETDPEFAGKSFVYHSGPGAPSIHATVAGQHFYGLDTGLCPGPELVHSYWAEFLVEQNFLNGVGSTPPNVVPWKVLKNGAHDETGPEANIYMRKLDYAIETQDLVIISGVRNNSGLPHTHPMFSHSFNGIASGRSDGFHRNGPTLAGFDGPGRQKPEMVAPSAAVSYAKPLVAGCATVLVETARSHPLLSGNPRAEHSETIKACVLAGGEHRPGWANNAPQSGPTRGVATQPLDTVYGVDEVDVDHAHWIITGGEHDGAATAVAATDTRHNGWDFMTLSSGESRFWRFQVEAVKPFMSVVVTWNRHVAPDFQSYTMADVNVELHAVDGQGSLVSLIGDPGLAYFGGGNVRSESDIDNLEHLYITNLQPGEYVLEVEREPDGLEDFDVAAAWELMIPRPVIYGTAKTTSTGLIPSINWRGYPSLAENDFEITISEAEPNKAGIFFYGVNGRKNKPFKGGLILVEGPLTRTPLLTTSATGSLELPINIDASMVGVRRNYQFWFRDSASPIPYGLSDAVEIDFTP